MTVATLLGGLPGRSGSLRLRRFRSTGGFGAIRTDSGSVGHQLSMSDQLTTSTSDTHERHALVLVSSGLPLHRPQSRFYGLPARETAPGLRISGQLARCVRHHADVFGLDSKGSAVCDAHVWPSPGVNDVRSGAPVRLTHRLAGHVVLSAMPARS